MKQAWDDLKSFITITVTLTIVTLLIITAVQQNWEMFKVVFSVFATLATATFTFYFSKPKDSSEPKGGK